MSEEFKITSENLKQMIKETEIEIINNLINLNPCPTISDDLVKVIDENVGKLNETSQNILRCVLKKFLSQFSPEKIFNLPNPEKVIIDLLNTKKILGQGHFGTTVLVGINSSKPFTVMKFSREIESDRHELAVGLLLNILRKEIPNFVYTYGGIICTNPTNIFNRKKGVAINDPLEGLCENKNNQSVIIFTEFIPGMNLQNFLDFGSSLSFEYIFNVITQVIYSVITANQKIDFIHTDLHDQNVLVKELENPIELNYEINLGEGYQQFNKFQCVTKHLSMIIDFGLSHYTFDNKKIDMGVKENINNDMYKYLYFISKSYNWVHYKDLDNLIDNIDKISLGEILKRWFEIRDKTLKSLSYSSTLEKNYSNIEKMEPSYDLDNKWF